MDYDYEKSPQGVRVDGENYNINYDWIFEYIGSLLDRCEGRVNVLEVGCGGGRNLEVIHSVFGDRVALTGIDVSKTAIEYARGLGVGDFHLMASDELALETKYDLILMIDVLEHLSSRAVVTRSVREGSKQLLEGGRIYVSVPIELNNYCLTRMFNRWGYTRGLTRRYYGHTLQYDIEDIKAIVDDAGLETEDAYFSVHWVAQVYILIFYFIPKLILEWMVGEAVATEMRDSNMEMVKGRHRLLGWIKKAWVAVGYPFGYVAYWESRIRRKSLVGAGNMHLILRSRQGGT